MGAAIALGSQKWNGTCADFVNAPSRISASATACSADARGSRRARRARPSSKLPAAWPEQEDAREQREPAGAVTMSAMRAPARIGALVPEADQQERGEARQLPEDEEQEQVVGEHDAEHRRHEDQSEA